MVKSNIFAIDSFSDLVVKSKPTSFDIAYRAGVSQSTVSRALRNSPLVNEETRQKVQAIAKELNLKEERFGFEPEVTAKLAKVKNLKIGEVPITYIVRSYEEGKKIGWKDGVKALYCIVKYSF